ncbi:MAG: PilZ domain-containing protein [Neptuniibacter sp.]
MQEQDRRQFFRIDQHISLELKVISSDEISDHPQPNQFDVSPNFLLLTELQQMDAASSQLLRKISEKDNNLSSFLQIIHDKIERIAQAIASSEMTISNAAIQEVNISEGGLQFFSDQPYEPDTFFSLKLVFPESCIGLLLYGTCVRSIPMADGRYQTSFEFVKMPESCRMILARQIIESQARQRKKAAEEAESI